MRVTGTGTFGRVCLCRERGAGSSQDGEAATEQRYWALKILRLADVIRLKQVEHVKNEKNILAVVRHPFIVHM
jgi:protein kinase X